jgi:hypothetical protein
MRQFVRSVKEHGLFFRNRCKKPDIPDIAASQADVTRHKPGIPGTAASQADPENFSIDADGCILMYMDLD